MRQFHLDKEQFLLASSNRAANSLHPFTSRLTMAEPCVIAIWGFCFAFEAGSYYVALAARKSLCQITVVKVGTREQVSSSCKTFLVSG